MAKGNPARSGGGRRQPAIRSLADVRRLLRSLPDPDEGAAAKARTREPTLTKPAGALGRLEGLSEWLAAWQGRHPPRMTRVMARVFAANHGVVTRGVSAYPPSVTAAMVANFAAGGAAINQLCRTFAVRLKVIPLNRLKATADFTERPAMSEAECVAALARGMAAVPRRADVLCLGEMGIGNTAAAAALCLALFGGRAGDWTGPGTGLKGRALGRKAAVVAEAARRHRPAGRDPFEALRRVGGFELAAITGAVLAARLHRIPVLLDGYVCTAAAAVLAKAAPGALAHCRVGHVSAEPGHRRLLARLGVRPLLDLDMRLGEATGAVLAVALLRAAVACHAGMATFAEAGVSGRER
jgi:nicotinate-nucleotide--dimethylbenzimidazole phosphoribosyltransferase